MKKKRELKLHMPGMRNIKTALCVLICLIITYIINKEITLYSSVAAIVCMQSSIENTFNIGINRLVGTAIGGGTGMLLIPLMEIKSTHNLFFLLMPLGIVLVIYICNLIKMPGAAVICAIVYITVLAAPITTAVAESPYFQAVYRMIDTAIGIVVAMLINRYIAPPKIYEDREMHLVCNTFDIVKSRINNFLDGDEALLLYDSALTKLENKKSGRPARIHPDLRLYINVPVPKELAKATNIKTVYVSSSYVVLPLTLTQCDGYVEIPANLLPCTIVWQSQEEIKELPTPLK